MIDMDKILGAAVREEEHKLQLIKNEIEELKKEKAKISSDKMKELDVLEQELKEKYNLKNREIVSRETVLLEREKTVEVKEKDYAALQENADRVREERKILESNKDEIQSIKAGYLEKQKQAELLIEQYEVKLKELANAAA